MSPAIEVSVIILNYNGREHLDACLTSLLSLDFPKERLEIIVVDNGSTDGSLGITKSRFSDVVLIQNETNLGFSRAANIGANHAKGEYVAFLNNDMRVEPKWLSVLLETAHAGKGFACVGSTVMNWEGTAVDFKGRTDDAFCLAYEPFEEFFDSSVTGYSPFLFASGGAVLFQRDVFLELEGFDPDFFLYNEDVDLGWRLWLRGYECIVTSKSVVYHRGGASSGKLPSAYVHRLSQTHTLASVFKNLETHNLKEILPIVLYLFLQRSRWVPAIQESLAGAVDDFLGSLDSLIARRIQIQQTRVRSDADIFGLLAHPLNFLIRKGTYQSIRHELLNGPDVAFDPLNAEVVRQAVSRWLNRAQFIYESQLFRDLVKSQGEARQLSDAAAGLNKTLRTMTAETEKNLRERDDLGDQVATLKDQVAGLNDQVAGLNNQVASLNNQVAGLNDQVAEESRKTRSVALELATKVNELNQIKSSTGWKWLSRYGELKYRRLLPVYRMLKLPPYGRPSATDIPTSEPAHFEGNGQVETIEDILRAKVPLPLESNACDILCFPIIDWDFRFQRPQQLMSRFAEAGHRVFYFKQSFETSGRAYLIQEKRENVYEVSLHGLGRIIYQDVLDNAARDLLFNSLDELRRDLMFGAAVTFVQLPFWWPLAQRTRDRFGWPIVYDCMDDHSGFSTNNPEMLNQEADLSRAADLIIASSLALEAQALDKNENVLLVRNACEYDHFSRTPESRNDRPLIGYYGAIADWFDSDLVADLAERRPDWDFVLVGSTFTADVARLSKLPNVTLTGEKPYSEIPEWLGRFDVAIIPFKRTKLTEATNPVKAYEILAAGKTLVSVSIPEMQALGDLVRLANTPVEFEQQISAALAEDDSGLVAKRRAFASDNTWEKRYEALTPTIRRLFPKASIVVVTYNNLELNRLCLESIFSRTEWPDFEVIVVDNNSTDGTREYLTEAVGVFPNLRIVLNDKNLGFAAANNIGLRQARGDYLVLLNNDTIVTRGWLSTLIRHLQLDPGIGLIGPVSNNIGNEARVDVGYSNLEEMPAWAADFTQRHDGQIFPIPMLAMFCLAMRKAVFEQIGQLDEQFGLGMFEDDDYAHRAKLQGWQVICAADVFIHHFGQASFKKLVANGAYQELFETNRRRFEQKWKMEWVPHQYAQSKE